MPTISRLLGTQFVHRVLRSVVEDIVVAVIEVDHIGIRDTAFGKRQVIVFNGALPGIKVGLVASTLSGSIDEVEKPRSRGSIAVDIQGRRRQSCP